VSETLLRNRAKCRHPELSDTAGPRVLSVAEVFDETDEGEQ
jgi:hypothetical protein